MKRILAAFFLLCATTSAFADDYTKVAANIVDGDIGTYKVTIRHYLDSNPMAVALTDGTGDLITTFPVSLAANQTVTQTPAASGGLSVFNGTSSDGGTALTNSAQVIKASAGQVFGWYIYNPNSTAQFVQFYNTASASVTVGTTNPLFMLTIPATAGANVEFSNGIAFSNAGFSCSATSTAGGNGAPTTALDAVIYYK